MAILQVALSLILIYLVFAIVVSGLQEWTAQYTGRRGKFLHLGMARLLNDQALFARVLQHPLVSGLYRQPAAQGKPPSYVEPRNFALALANVLVRRGAPPTTTSGDAGPNPDALTQAHARVLDHASLRTGLVSFAAQRSPVASALLPIVDRAKDLEGALQGIEGWFNSGMDRVSGWYKTRTQKVLFVIGLLVAALANVDTLEIVEALNRSPDLRAALTQIAQESGQTGKLAGVDLAQLRDRPPTEAEWKAVLNASIQFGSPQFGHGRLPLGYACLDAVVALPSADSTKDVAQAAPGASAGSWQRCVGQFRDTWGKSTLFQHVLKLLGWVLTALAGVLGAPFWFAALSSVANLRGSGPKPATVDAASATPR